MIAEQETQVSEELSQQALTHVEWARLLTISAPEQFEEAAERLKGIKALEKEIVDFFGPHKKRASDAHKALVADEKKQLEPLAVAEQMCKRAMLTYQQAEQKKAEAERQRLQAIADEKARKERERIEQEAAKQRAIEAEQKRVAEEARRQAEQASAAERKKLLEQASAAERKASAAAAKQEVQAEAAAAVTSAPVIHVATAAPKVNGVSTSKTWKARVKDRNLVPREYMTVDEKALNKIAVALRERACVPGVEFYTEEVVSVKGR